MFHVPPENYDIPSRVLKVRCSSSELRGHVCPTRESNPATLGLEGPAVHPAREAGITGRELDEAPSLLPRSTVRS